MSERQPSSHSESESTPVDVGRAVSRGRLSYVVDLLHPSPELELRLRSRHPKETP